MSDFLVTFPQEEVSKVEQGGGGWWREEREARRLRASEVQRAGRWAGGASKEEFQLPPPVFDAFLPSHSTFAVALPLHIPSDLL